MMRPIVAGALLSALTLGAYAQQPQVTYTYDALGRLAKVETSDGKKVTYQYDTADNRSLVTAELPEGVTLIGTNDNDTLTGTAGADTISGLGGHDTLHGLDGRDKLIGGEGNDHLLGGAGDDAWWVHEKGLWGEAGNDTLVGGPGSDQMYAGTGDDTFLADNDGGAEVDYFFGEVGGVGVGGNDLASYELWSTGVTVDLSVRLASDPADPYHYYTTAHGDFLHSIESLRGTAQSDTLTGDWNANRLYGEGGRDKLVGGEGDDHLWGGPGDDMWWGHEKGLWGEGGNDFLAGGPGSDQMFGGTGHDSFLADADGGAEADYFFGEAGGVGVGGYDLVSYENWMSGVAIDLSIRLSADPADAYHYYTVAYGDYLHSIESLVGSDYNDTLKGDWNFNAFYARAGSDTLEGGDAADILDGGSGIDTARFAGVRTDYNFTAGAGVVYATHLPTGSSDTLVSIETAFFIGSQQSFAIQDLL